jgi:putative ABC transport system permease protein
MSWLGEQARRVRMLLGWRRARRDLEEEMRLHRDLRAREEGRAAAERRFGEELRLRERSLEVWGWTWLESLGQDVRHALRRLARTPVATGLAVLSLTLGIGASTTLFTLTDAMLFRPLPVDRPQQLVELTNQFEGRTWPSFSNPLWERFRDRQRALAGVLAYDDWDLDVGSGANRRRAYGIYASGTFFPMLGVHAERGRLLGPKDDGRACSPVTDISDDLWRSQFGAAASALGGVLEVSGHKVAVIGVMPSDFFGVEAGRRLQIVLPICELPQISGYPGILQDSSGGLLRMMGRLWPGESARIAQARIAALMPALAPALPKDEAATGGHHLRILVRSTPQGAESWVQGLYGSALLMLAVLSGAVLLVACTNLAGLMLARAAAQRDEIAVRLALGATRFRLVRQQMMESLLLATGGMALGAIFAAWACPALEHLAVSQGSAAVTLALTPDAHQAEFALYVTLATALLVGLGPALRATRAAAIASPRPASGASPLAGRWTVSLQVALTFVLLAGGVLFARNFENLIGPGKGFAARNVFLATVIEPRGHPAPPGTLSALRALPGVQMASASSLIPVQGPTLFMEVQSPAGSRRGPGLLQVRGNVVATGFFRVTGTALLRGRDFDAGDTPSSRPVAMVNATLARLLFPRGDLLGRRVTALSPRSKMAPYTIVGVVADAKYRRLQSPTPPTLYYAWNQLSPRLLREAFYLKSPLPEASLARAVRRTLARLAPGARPQMTAFRTVVDDAARPQQLLALISGLFAGLALLVAAIGIYGVLAYSATLRRKEYGIRTALGAKPAAIARLALREAAAVVAAGGLAGGLLLWLASRAALPMLSQQSMRHGALLYQVRPDDAMTLAAAAALLGAAALGAAWLPARRAAHADPLAALRGE